MSIHPVAFACRDILIVSNPLPSKAGREVYEGVRPCLLRAQENPNSQHFVYTPLRPPPFFEPVYFFASVYPVATGSAAILPTIAPKSRRVKWFSASISQ